MAQQILRLSNINNLFTSIEPKTDSSVMMAFSDNNKGKETGFKKPKSTDEKVKPLRPKEFNSSENLTPREQQILKLIVKGYRNKQIAQIIDRTTRTVEYHRNRLMRKLNAHNAAQLTCKAITHNLVKL